MRKFYTANLYGFFDIVNIDDEKKEYDFDCTRADNIPDATPLDGRDYYKLLEQLDTLNYSCLIPF